MLDYHRFCGACGSSLTSPPAAEKAQARKVVTIVFADLIGSTALHERLDPESVSRVMEPRHGADAAAGLISVAGSLGSFVGTFGMRAERCTKPELSLHRSG